MPGDGEQSVEIRYTPEFKRNLRQLAKRYRHIRIDVDSVLDALAQGQSPGDQIAGVDYEVFKVRVANSDSRKGKSGGYRVIYERTAEGPIVLVTIYSKTEQQDIDPHEIRRLILAYAAQNDVEPESCDPAVDSEQ